MDSRPNLPLDPHFIMNWENRYQTGDMPWEKGAPSPGLVEYLETHPALTGKILVPGCGWGHDVRAISRATTPISTELPASVIPGVNKDYEVIGLDIAPSAIHGAQSFPVVGNERYQLGDLFEDILEGPAHFLHVCDVVLDHRHLGVDVLGDVVLGGELTARDPLARIFEGRRQKLEPIQEPSDHELTTLLPSQIPRLDQQLIKNAGALLPPLVVRVEPLLGLSTGGQRRGVDIQAVAFPADAGFRRARCVLSVGLRLAGILHARKDNGCGDRVCRRRGRPEAKEPSGRWRPSF